MEENRVNPSATATDPWAEVAARLGADLFLDLQPDPGASARGRGATLRRTLTEALRSAILDGRLPAGTALPPYRSLAADLGLARGTVSAVYQELIAEGWLTARQGSATRVADGAAHPETASNRKADERPSTPSPFRFPHDFSLGQPCAGMFPRTDWIRATRRVLTGAGDEVFAPTHPQGRAELRRALSGYLSRTRGVRTTADLIVLGTAVQSALELLSRGVFGDVLAVEGHGLPFHWQAVVRGGTRVVPIAVDDEGMVIDDLERSGAAAVLLSPSHQFPTGVPLSPARRMQVIEWARRTGAVIVEDDYDGEFRYDRDPVGALQALGPDVVIHAGSMSKSLSPAVRAGWLALPPHLMDVVMNAKGVREGDASIVDQLILADLIDSGAYDRHIRRSRQVYRQRRDALVEAVTACGLGLPGIAAGLHAVIPVDHADEGALVHEAFRRGIGLVGLSLFRHPDADPLPHGGLVVGFGTPAASTFTADLQALRDLLAESPAARRVVP
ncbi:PLP-dependent aminotransferase family protein [Gordonia alkanivorans]|uniref:MocR-like pyridoxine biosynthesis transcription factor PdxR n=1 Tax=Gordonia alkanivorans TaxID=84096 RepID=UPI00244C3800|nr:PLP-dependent aminotransferase family protein [Gordonia alkanivorans]MDH3005336.1 PLP-dependent aminotransferase family protein [Gordonia alkanivorans]MDH3014748.1 PLP-dependent aminotransferase family protein [Gordonia alkanivorans]MDH3039631.1 PLP-dependent aminotransferase family protein [Gordonia alkanivorans]MDH3060302.1 PLP-dependent aminotransferase family protein [Gordonia alkanivorans]